MDSVYKKMIDTVKKWDPFGFGPDFYETEAVDVIQIASEFDDPQYIAVKVQHVYFMSFEEVIPLEKCRALAEQLLELKGEGSCGL